MGKHFPLQLHKFKKVKEDVHQATLVHPDGHQITIAKKPLSAKLRGQIAELPMAEDPTQKHKIPGDAIPNKIEKNVVNQAEKKMAGGGTVWGSSQGDVSASEAASNAKKSLGAGSSDSAPKQYANPNPDAEDAASQGEDQASKEYGPAYAKGGKICMDEGGSIPAPPTPDQLAPYMPTPDEEANSGLPPGPQRAYYMANRKYQQAQGASSPSASYDQGGQVQNPKIDESKKTLGETINYPGSSPKANYADGSYQPVSQDDASSQQQSPVNININPNAPIPDSQLNPNAPQLPNPDSQAPVQVAPQSQAPQNDPYGNEAYNQAYVKGLNEQKAGLRGEALASGKQGQLENQALQQANDTQKNMMDQYSSNFADLQNEYHNFQQDVMNQHIDPQHYLNSMGTGQKIATGIGLILGGMGGGLTHQGNPVLDFLNRQISNDIDAQKANLGKSENLLNANLRQFGNIHDAAQMTYAMQQGIVANQLRQAAAQTTDQMAKGRALQAAGQLDQAAAPVLSQIAMRRTLTNGANTGQVPPENVIRAYIPPGPQQDAHYKELQTAQNMARSRDNLLSAFDQVSELNTASNRLLSPIQTARQINAISEPLLAQLVKDSEGRITPQDTKMISGILHPGVFDSDETKAVARNQLNKFVSEKMNFPMLKAIGIDAQKFGRYDPAGRNRIQESAPKYGQ